MAVFDAHKNLAYSAVTNNPGSAGTTLTVTTGQGALFPAVPFNCTVWPAGVQPLASNAEIVRVTAIAADSFTITRAQEGTTAKTIAASYQIANSVSVKVLTDIEAAANLGITNAASAQATANTAETDAQTGITNAAAAQSTANTALTTANAAVPQTTTVNGHPLSSNVTVSASDVGLGNVPNVNATNASNISSGTLGAGRLPLATTTTVGGVIVPTSGNLAVDGSGNITVPLASSSVLGVVKVDNTTITASSGVISAVAGAAYTDPLVLSAQALGSTMKAQTAGMSLLNCSATAPMANQTIFWQAVYLPLAATLTGVYWFQRTIGNYTGNNFNGVGLYSYSGGTLTQVAVSSNTASAWQTAASSTFGHLAFTGTYSASAGLYFVALLYCQSAQTTAPVIAAGTSGIIGAQNSPWTTNSGTLGGTTGSQTTLPASIASSSISNSTYTSVWVAIY